MYRGQHAAATIGRFPGVGDFRGPTELTDPQRKRRLEQIQNIRKVRIIAIFTPTYSTVSTVLLQRLYKEVVLWSTLSHPNVLKLFAVEDMEKAQFLSLCRSGWTGPSWTTLNSITSTDWIWCVTSLSPPFPSLKCDNSCMGWPRVWNISIAPVLHTGT